MLTYAQFVDDVLETMGYGFDDRLRNRESALYNAGLIFTKLRNQDISKSLGTGDLRDSASHTSTYIVPITHVNAPDDSVTDYDSSYFILPTGILDLDNGKGIAMVRYLRNDLPPNCPPMVARTPFTQTTMGSVYGLYQSAYQSPRADRPYFAQTEDRILLYGVPPAVRNLFVQLYKVPGYVDLDPDAVADLPSHLLLTAKKMMLELEGWALQVPQERLKNDGRDLEPGQVVRTSPAISVNHPSQAD